MASYEAPSAKTVYTTVYDNFLGVDLVSDDVNVSKNRFADCRNIMLDSSGYPEKRYGFKALCAALGSEVHSMKEVETKNGRFLAVHIGKRLYKCVGDAVTALCDASGSSDVLYDCKSDIFCAKDKIWIFSAQGIKVYDGADFYSPDELAYVPTTSALRNYHTIRYKTADDVRTQYVYYTDPGGFYEYVNLLTKKRINTFALNDFFTNYNYGDYLVTSLLYTDGAIKELEKVEFLNQDGTWRDVTSYATASGNIVSFNIDKNPAAPFITTSPIENVRITFVADIEDKNYITGCTFGTFYGEGDDGRLFLSGNKSYPNYEWYSEYNDLTYFPDTNYCVVGSESAIVGYSKIGDSLLIMKEKSADDSAVYLQNANISSAGSTYFSLRQCFSEVGAISDRAITEVDGMPLFVTENGIYAIISNSITSEKQFINKSFYVNPMLTEDSSLSAAALCRYKEHVYCSTGDMCYVFQTDAGSGLPYNAFLWESIPATVFAQYDGALYFGTSDGRICKFCREEDDDTRFDDYPEYKGAPRAIAAYFTTKLDTDGSFMTQKNMVKRGCGVMIKPYARSSVRVYTLTEEEHEKQVIDKTTALFDFGKLYFDIVDFSTRAAARIIPFNTKVKKYGALQFKILNDRAGQGFGVLGVEKRYTVGNYRKR